MKPESVKYKIDFGTISGITNWSVINDDIMGGLSQSTAIYTDNSLMFKGSISLKNNGGFASVRSPEGAYNLNSYSTLVIKYRCNTRLFSVKLSTSASRFEPNYKHSLNVTEGIWETAKLNLSDFKAYIKGHSIGMKFSKENRQIILRIGLIILDKVEGSFGLEVDYIEFY